jgi:hypothetical protein
MRQGVARTVSTLGERKCAIDTLKLFRYAPAGLDVGWARYLRAVPYWVCPFMPYRDGSRDVPPLMRTLRGIGIYANHFERPRCGTYAIERSFLLHMRGSGAL